MKRGLISFVGIVTVMVLIGAITGCSIRFYRGHPDDLDKISELSGKLSELEEAKALLEERLKSEIRDRRVKLDITKRGLVITFVDEVLFESGKVLLKEEAGPILDTVIGVIKEKVADRNIGIEGHTDNEPIKHSGWKSNWELSTARATEVLHYLEDSGIKPGKLQATGFGEHRPVTSNNTTKGRQQNRRVEIVILPAGIDKVSYGEEPEIK